VTLRDQLERFHAAITGRAPLDTARDLVEAGSVGARELVGAREPGDSHARVDEIERLHVYEHAYTARIAGVLVHDYPKLAQLVGEDVLRSWTASYVRAYPPSNFSLREVGAHLAPWLSSADVHVGAPRVRGLVDRERDRSHADAHVGAHLVDLENHRAHADAHVGARLWTDLARLERARTEVFDGPDATPLSREDLSTLDPAEFPSLKLRLVPSSRVVSLATNADEVWDSLENDTSTCGNSSSSTSDTSTKSSTSTSDTSTSDTSTSDTSTSASTSDTSTSDTSTSDTSTSDASTSDTSTSDAAPKNHAASRDAGAASRVVLAWRRDLVVIHRTLDADEARIVPMMITGTTFGAVCELLDEETAAERAIELLVRWLDAQILART
jgi:hypothetical protein